MKEMMNSDKWIESDRNVKISHLDLLHISSHLVVHQSKPVSHIKFENSSSFGAFVHLRPTLPKTLVDSSNMKGNMGETSKMNGNKNCNENGVPTENFSKSGHLAHLFRSGFFPHLRAKEH